MNQKKPKNVKLHKNNSMNIKIKFPIQANNNISSNKANNMGTTDLFFNKRQTSNTKLNNYLKNSSNNKKASLIKQRNINVFKNKLGQLQLNTSNFSCYYKNTNQINNMTNKNNLTKIIKNTIPNKNIKKYITLQRNITFSNNLCSNLSKNISQSKSKSKSNSKNLSKELMNKNNRKKTILEKYIKRKYLTKSISKNNVVKNKSLNVNKNKMKKNLFKQKHKSSNLLITKYYKEKNCNKNKRNNSKNLSNNFSNNNSISKKNNSLCNNNNTNSLVNNSINKKYLPNKQIMYFMKRKKRLNKTKNYNHINLANKNIKNQKFICINNYTNKDNNYLINERLKTEQCCEEDTTNNFILPKKYSKKDLLFKNLFSNDNNKELYETESPLKSSTDKDNKDNSDALSFEEVKDIIIYNNLTDIDIKKEYLFRKEERKFFEKNDEIKYIDYFFNKNNAMDEGHNKIKSTNFGSNCEMLSLDTEYSSKMKTKVNKNLVKNI